MGDRLEWLFVRGMLELKSSKNSVYQIKVSSLQPIQVIVNSARNEGQEDWDHWCRKSQPTRDR
eukprot:scaffold165374_cov17-Prasinocladus_malaysianus.AAC.1